MWNESEDHNLAQQLQKQFDGEQIAQDVHNTSFDDDHFLALQLQKELQSDDVIDPSSSKAISNSNQINEQSVENMSLVDPRWELIDPNPDVRTLFLQFNDRFFWGKLSCVEVRWSPRMTLCAGLCVYEGRGGLCSVRLSTPLLKLRPRTDLIETLLHEMIHAYLFVTDNNKDHDGHGPEFHKHMYRINNETGTKISVYHNFHDEVNSYRQHWWRCDGPCRSKQPYFGYVKRSMNRVPSARDPWWPAHQQSCGGTYTKVKEPEGYGEKKKKKESLDKKQSLDKKETLDKKNEPKKNSGVDIRSLFGKNKDTTSTVSKPNNSLTSDIEPKKKGANIAGFVHGGSGGLQVYKDEDNTINMKDYTQLKGKGANINGFKRGDSESDLQVYSHKTETDAEPSHTTNIELFSGTGKTIGRVQNNGQSSKIVRKLPGFGVIENERPQFSVNNRESGKQDIGSDSDDPKTLIFSPHDQNKRLFSPQENNKLPKLDLSDSDSDFDALLKKMPKGKKLTKSKKSLSPGNTVSIDKFMIRGDNGIAKSLQGFKSVSMQNKQTSGIAGKFSSKNDKVEHTKSNNVQASTSKQLNIEIASERNKRALTLDSSSDSEIDSLERQSIKSFVKKKRCNSPTKNENATHSKLSVNGTNNDAKASTRNESNMVPCPVCQTKVTPDMINQHLDTCLS